MLITDLDLIKKISTRNDDKNWQFRSFLKSLDLETEEIDAIVHRLYDEISSQIDCTECGNCCKVFSPVLDEADIKKLANVLDVSPGVFIGTYLTRDEEELIFEEKPCPLLNENKCSVYDCRPKECESFPHLQNDEFVFRTIGIIQNCSICPIVFNVFERLKCELWQYNDLDENNGYIEQ